MSGLTEAGFQPGTLLYMSPEQIRGEAVDGRSDVYQVGALLYEMLAGRCTIDMEALTRQAQETAGGNVLRMQARLYELLEEAICEHQPQDLRRLRPDAPAWLGAIVAATLAPASATRPTAKWLAGELRDGGKSKSERPAPVKQSQSAATAKVDTPSPPVAGAQIDHTARGASALSEGRLDEAIREYQAALRINPDYADAHCALGMVYKYQGRTDEAIREYQAALRINPNDADAHCGLGSFYADQGRMDAARREARLALQLGCEDARYLLAKLG